MCAWVQWGGLSEISREKEAGDRCEAAQMWKGGRSRGYCAAGFEDEEVTGHRVLTERCLLSSLVSSLFRTHPFLTGMAGKT